MSTHRNARTEATRKSIEQARASREITVTTKVTVPPAFTDERAMGNIQDMLLHGITDEVNSFLEDECPGVHVTYCRTDISA